MIRFQRSTISLLLALGMTLLSACSPPPQSLSEQTKEPATTAVQEEAEPAPVMPIFAEHTPFLFADERGFIRPDDPLSADELAQAMTAIFPAEKELGLSTGEETVTADALRELLTGLLGEEKLPALPTEGELSRAAFASVMTGLMGTGGGETVQVQEGALAPVDLPTDAAFYTAVLEACVPHKPGGELSWEEAAPGTGYEPGPFLIDGRLRYCGEDGRLLKNTTLGPLTFDANGLYTTGDEELDGYVAEILLQLIAENPDDAGDRMLMLRHVYDYALRNFHYVGRGSHFDGDGWEYVDAKTMLETGKGDCYNYAAGFAVLARGLGFPANVILRSLDAPENLHAWTDIVIDETPYIFDPQLEKNFKNNRYMLTYKQGERYGYRRPFDTPGEIHEPAEDLVWVAPTERGELLTDTGEGGMTYLVYLPYGYDESKQYNVLILLYGADGDPFKMLGTANAYAHQNRYFGHYITTPAFVDFLVQRGECDSLILASVKTAMTDGQSGRYISLLQYVVNHFSTYAASSAIEDLIAARDHFGIAGPSSASQGICLAMNEMPDVFGYFGLFSGISRLDEAVAGMAQRQHACLVLGVGDRESMKGTVQKAYERFSELDNVDAYLTIFPNSEHEWSAFDGALREFLILFSPKGGR